LRRNNIHRKSITVDGEKLNLEKIQSILLSKIEIEVDTQALATINKSYKFLNQQLQKQIIYGVNTGFGPMASHILGKDQIVELQSNLIRSHAVGMGDKVEDRFVLAAMVVRINTLIRGYSGVSPELINQLKTLINHRIIPIVPEHGAVGTSGDLVQLAHIALCLIGEGEAVYNGIRKPVKVIFKELGIQPLKLKPKEGLALINGTSFMSGIGSQVCLESERLLNLATKTGAMALELVRAFPDSFSKELNDLRPHNGQVFIAQKLRNLLEDSKLLRDRIEFQKNIKIEKDVKEIQDTVQEVYSIRCIPQILGPIYDTLQQTRKIIETEINSVTDNPILDLDSYIFLHGGNFHGDYVAVALDQLKMTLVKLTMLSERRINFFLNRNINKFLPYFINLKKPGLNLGLQALQFVATSTTAQNQTYAFPHNVHSIPTNGDNQDIVSMGTDVALLTEKVVNNAFIVLAIELVTLTQAVDYLEVQSKLSKSSLDIYTKVRSILPKLVEDRVLIDELEILVKTLKLEGIK
jgi:histidine ammonia-lyase